MSMIGNALGNWQRQNASVMKQGPLTLITEEKEYEPKEYSTSNPETIVGNKPNVVKLVMVQIPETGEYKIKWIQDGVFSEAKSYYTDDFKDAIATAEAMASEAKRAGFYVIRIKPEELRPTSSNPGEPQDYERELEQLRKDLHEGAISEENYKKAVKEILARKHQSISSNPGELTTVQCPICGDVIEVPGYDAITRSEALKRHLETKHSSTSNPGEPIGSNFHSLMLHAVAEMYGPGGIVVDEAKAKATSCQCVEYKPSKLWCTSKGVVGALTDEQEKIYCNPMEMVERPGVKERLTKWGEAVKICRAKLPPTDGRTRLEIYLDCMSKELTKAGVEA